MEKVKNPVIRKTLSCKVSLEYYNKVKAFAFKHKLTMSKLIVDALNAYMKGGEEYVVPRDFFEFD